MTNIKDNSIDLDEMKIGIENFKTEMKEIEKYLENLSFELTKLRVIVFSLGAYVRQMETGETEYSEITKKISD